MTPALQRIGLTPEQVKLAALRFGGAEQDRLRRNFALMVRKMSRGRGGLPDYVVAAMHADYQRVKSLSKVGALYGRTRQAMWDIFHSHDLPLERRNFLQKILFDGRVFTPGKDDYFRATTGPREPLHHAMWIKQHGPIPAGHQVFFLDGDATHLFLANLGCAPIAEVSSHHQRRIHASARLSPAERIIRRKQVGLAYYYRRSRKFLKQGLTVQGKPRRRRETLTPIQRAEANREKCLVRYQNQAANFKAQGLTTRGTPPRRGHDRHRTEFEKAWLEFRATLGDTTPPDFFDHISENKSPRGATPQSSTLNPQPS